MNIRARCYVKIFNRFVTYENKKLMEKQRQKVGHRQSMLITAKKHKTCCDEQVATNKINKAKKLRVRTCAIQIS